MKIIILAWFCSLASADSGNLETLEDGSPILPEKDAYVDRFHRLKKLAESDLKIVKFLVAFRDNLTSSSNTAKIPGTIDEYINDFTRGNGPLSEIRWTKKTAENVAKNPISAYRLLRRYAFDLPKILENMKLPSFVIEKLNGFVIPEKMKWPTAEDLEYAIDGILWIQQIYNISAEQFSRGSLGEIEVSGNLDLEQIYDIGDRALSNEFYALAIEWWEFGLRKIQAENVNVNSEEAAKFTQFLQIAKDFHDNELRKGDELNTWLYDHLLLNEDESNGTQIVKRVKRRETLYEKFKRTREPKHMDITLLGICNGENYQTEEEKSRLFCWYEFTVHPKYRIAPLKAEFLSRQPDVYMVYDFVGDSIIKKIRSAALRQTVRSVGPFRKHVVLKENFDSNGRGVTNFLWDGVGTTLGIFSLAQNVQDATGLRATQEEDADRLYVKGYTWASFSKSHTDSLWIANAMHYLNNVDAGGFTAFPQLGFAVKPLKGALLVWYNQLRDQTTDHLTEHKSCPVIFGWKQIATKWIAPGPQFRKFPCHLKRGQRFKTRVNGRLDY